MPIYAFALRHVPVVAFTFADRPGITYVGVRRVAKALGLRLDAAKHSVTLDDKPLNSARKLGDGTLVASLREMAANRGEYARNPKSDRIQWTVGDFRLEIAVGDKKVTVDKTRQMLKAYQGQQVVLVTRISSGTEGFRTPDGQFRAGPLKERMHRSRQYQMAPMPWSIQLDKGIFLHGNGKVRGRPESHGCIRLPMKAAHWLYAWIDIGTPVSVSGYWHRARARSK